MFLVLRRIGYLTTALSTFACGQASALDVGHAVTNVNGLSVDRYTWRDASGRPRSVSLKRQGDGNPGNGGYAVQMTYQYLDAGTWRTVTVNQTSGGDGGFGYFVGHERYRDFSNGSQGTIAARFGADDSPLGRRFPVVGTHLPLGARAAGHRFTLDYPRYGTVQPIAKDANGNDVSPTPFALGALKKYTTPVAITWVFQTGTDFPRIQTTVSLAELPGPDRVNFDIRGPYGVMNFDNGANRPVARAMWGDRYHFSTSPVPLTRNRNWTWNAPNSGARYQALVAGSYEMGLFEPKRFAISAWVDGWAGARGRTSATYNGGNGCRPDLDQLIPCDWEWPYQSAQYSLPYDDSDGTTTFEKIAWGSAPFWGTGPSMTEVYDTNSKSRPFKGFPANKRITYSVCVVLGRTIAGGLTKSAAAGPDYRCATATVP